MSKKLILFLMLALFGSTSFLRADEFEVQIGEGTGTTGYFPFYTLYNYSIGENLYLASELQDAGMSAGTVTSLSYYATNSTGYEQQGISLWMANVNETELTTTSHITTAMTLVYTGSVTPEVGWNEFVFNVSEFEWDGESNVLIFCQRNNGAWNSTISWQATSGLDFNAMAYRYQDSGAFDVTVANTMYTSTTRPNVIFKGNTSGGGPVAPWNPDYNANLGDIELVNPIDGAQNVHYPTTLRWNNAENAAQYLIQLGTVYNNLETIVDWTDVEGWSGSVALANLGITLDPNTRYFWRVYNQNNVDMTYVQGVFTSECTTATNVRVTADEIFVDESTIVKWSITGGSISGLPETQIGSGTSTSSYLPTYNLYNYSFTEQIYTGEEIGGAGIINSISFYPVGSITRNLDIYMVNTDKESFSGATDWIAVSDDDMVYSGEVAMVPDTWVTVELEEPFVFDGSNLAIIVDDNTGTWTSSVSYYVFDATAQALRIYSDGTNYDPTNPSSYSGTVMNVKNQIIINKEDAKDGNRDLIGCNVYVDSVKVNDTPITERQYLLEGLSYNMEGHTINVTGVYDIGESNFSAPAVVYVSGYGNLAGTVKELMSATPISGATVKIAGKDEFNNPVTYTTTTSATGAYGFDNIEAGTYKVTASFAGMENEIVEGVVVEYNNTTNLDIIYMHENYTPVYKVYAEEAIHMGNNVADVIWSFSNFANPGGGGGGTGDTFTVDFESGIPAGWTTIDGGSPTGYGWQLASNAMGTGYGHNGSADCVISKSYDNNYGVVYPDNYIISPMVNIANGSTFSFWACAQDASYAAEHFGVAISTTTNTTASAFTTIEEWTMTAKEGPKGTRGMNAQGNWYQKTVDLSAYAGQQIYIAVRHFNCSDQFYLDADDFELSNGAKVENRGTLVIDFETGDFSQYEFVNNSAYPWVVVAENGSYVMKSSNSGVASSSSIISATVDYQTDGTVSFDALCMGEGTSTIWDKCIFKIDNVQQFCYGANVSGWNNYVFPVAAGTHTFAWEYSKDSSVNPTGDYMAVDNIIFDGVAGGGGTYFPSDDHYFIVYRKNILKENFEEETIELLADEYGLNFADTMYTDNAYASLEPGVYQYGVSAVYPWMERSGNVTDPTWSNPLSKDMNATVVLKALANSSEYYGAEITLTNNYENRTYNVVFDEYSTDTIYDFRKGEYTVTAELDGYTSDLNGVVMSIWEDMTITANFTEVLAPTSGLAVSGTGFARWTDVIPAVDVAMSYYLTLDGAFIDETVLSFYQIDDAILTVGHTYEFGVAVYYTTGLSEYVTTTFTYIGCEGVDTQVTDLEASNEGGDLNVLLTWGSGTGPTPPPTPPTPPTGGWTEGFENGLPSDWTVVDANNDGWTWCLTSAIPTTWTYYATLTLDWYRTGTNAICSGSYINGVGALTPDEYLVMGQQTIVAGTTLSFWAAAADAGYPADHFGVFVSDNGTSWTSVQEWTLTAKEGGMNGGRASRDGDGAKLGSWHQFTADLSAYAGTKYIAIRHFNCTDQYIMVVDDIEFATPDKGDVSLASAGYGFGATNGETTRDWYYYDNGINDDAIGLTSGGSFYWGIMFPAGTYEGNKVTKVSYFDYVAHTGTVSIYNGGTSAPQTLIHSQGYSVSGTSQYVEFEMNEDVVIDNTQPLWVVMHNNNGQYVAAIDAGPGVNYGSCLSTDGSTWYTSVASATGGSLDGNWNLRVYVEAGGGGGATALVPNKYNVFLDGDIYGATADEYMYVEAPDFELHYYTVVWIDANYNISCENTIEYMADDATPEMGVIKAMYPNPTNGDLHVYAPAMQRVSIINALGQMVYDQAVDCDQMVIDMSQLEAGVYMVNVITENGSSIKRVTVTK